MIGALLTRLRVGVGVTFRVVADRDDLVGQFVGPILSRTRVFGLAGGEPKHQPAFFIRRKETDELVNELGASADSQTPISIVNDGRNNGAYVAKELVYAYAMWISPAFHLKVIRAYDAAVAKPAGLNAANLSRLQLLEMAMQAGDSRLLPRPGRSVDHHARRAVQHIQISEGSRGPGVCP